MVQRVQLGRSRPCCSPELRDEDGNWASGIDHAADGGDQGVCLKISAYARIRAASTLSPAAWTIRKGSALLALTSGASDIKRLLGDIDPEYSLTHPITKVIQTCNTAPHRALLYTGSAACHVPRYRPACTAEQEKAGPQLSNWLSRPQSPDWLTAFLAAQRI